MLLYYLGTGDWSSPQESKGSVSFRAVLLNCVFHFKSVVIVTLRYLMFSTFPRTVPSGQGS